MNKIIIFKTIFNNCRIHLSITTKIQVSEMSTTLKADQHSVFIILFGNSDNLHGAVEG